MTSSQFPKIQYPTVNFYHYELRNGLNDSEEEIKERRDYFTKNLDKLTFHLTSKQQKNAGEFVRLISFEQDMSPFGSLLDLTWEEIPEDCKKKDKPNDDCLYLETGNYMSSLAVRRLNDTYLLHFTRYSLPKEGEEQSLATFANLCEHLCTLPIELGQTVILSGIISSNNGIETIDIAAECLRKYSTETIISQNLISSNFLGNPFYYILQKNKDKKENNSSIETNRLVGIVFYKDAKAKETADNINDSIMKYIFLTYHKIKFCYSQSFDLKQTLSHQYEEIEQLTKDFSKTQWDKNSLKLLPHKALSFYQNLSFLSDQEKTLRANLYTYKKYIQKIKKYTEENVSNFFVDFVNDAEHYLKQIETTIGFMSPGLQLYDKLMLSVQTQVSIDDETIQKQQSDQQQKLGQLLTGSCATIAIGQILSPAITATVSQNHIDKDPNQPPSVSSLWWGGLATIVLSILSGLLLSRLVYRWFTNKQI
ncbi:hypothetical protein AmaxDRAFT_5003 [Limnospira maxima CS-328]|uniref:Uncharacterized protein n=1 Tax=Limnospira maxima CS-328 TaxID=513049 RepID=B5W8A3_LIMMA|nr:hypothetical protein [Limnospira maxima]EDZ92264.1 hypothetical protein AmaxDRAFT_5003 [Limnospira maxima CS-328]MDC0837795.1 hypothetical protein [Limnoraphis robusta]